MKWESCMQSSLTSKECLDIGLLAEETQLLQVFNFSTVKCNSRLLFGSNLLAMSFCFLNSRSSVLFWFGFLVVVSRDRVSLCSLCCAVPTPALLIINVKDNFEKWNTLYFITKEKTIYCFSEIIQEDFRMLLFLKSIFKKNILKHGI